MTHVSLDAARSTYDAGITTGELIGFTLETLTGLTGQPLQPETSGSAVFGQTVLQVLQAGCGVLMLHSPDFASSLMAS